jgi:hypothetical protein
METPVVTQPTPDGTLMQMIAAYMQLSLHSVQKMVLQTRGGNVQWKIDQAFASLVQNYQQMRAQATQAPLPVMSPEDVQRGLQQMLGGLPAQPVQLPAPAVQQQAVMPVTNDQLMTELIAMRADTDRRLTDLEEAFAED